MAVRTFGEAIVEFSGESLTTGTAATAIGIPPGVAEVIVYGAVAHRIQIGAKIALCAKTIDNEATFTNYTKEAIDRNTATLVTLSSLPTAANGGYWYVASKHKFAGCTIDVVAPNGTASVMTGYYWNGSSWVDASITDGTVSVGACLAIDGSVIWTVAAAWTKTTLDNQAGLYVIRFQVSAALDTSTTLAEIALLPDAVAAPYGYMAATTDYVFSLNAVECGSLAFTAGAGSTVSLSWIRHSKLGGT